MPNAVQPVCRTIGCFFDYQQVYIAVWGLLSANRRPEEYNFLRLILGDDFMDDDVELLFRLLRHTDIV